MSFNDPKAGIVEDRAPKCAGLWRPAKNWRTEYDNHNEKKTWLILDRYRHSFSYWPSIAGISSYYSAAANRNKPYHMTTVIQLQDDINLPVL